MGFGEETICMAPKGQDRIEDNDRISQVKGPRFHPPLKSQQTPKEQAQQSQGESHRLVTEGTQII